MSEQTQTPIPIFDGHNDTVLSLRSTGRSFAEPSEAGHIDLPRARSGGLAGGFFAVWVPDPAIAPPPGAEPDPNQATAVYGDEATMPPRMGVDYAQNYALSSLGRLYRLEAELDGQARVVRTVKELLASVAEGVFAIELHLEGAEPIDPELESLEVFYQAGVRSIGLVWSRSNAFASGVPFKFPSSPDVGPGLTDAGKQLVRACNRLGIMIDVSHLNEAGFWDVAKITDAPIVATHSNAHAICPSTRNLTDRQLDAIRDSGGVVGVNFHVGFLRPDGRNDSPETTPLSLIGDQVDYLVERLGVDKVGLGSDFDGATMPGDLRDAAGLPKLVADLRARGYDDATLRLLGYENWARVLDRTWKG